MTIWRLPLILLLGGLFVKTLLVALWRGSQGPELMTLLTTLDPGAFAFAVNGVASFYDQRRIAPTPAEATLFEALLIIGFGVECMLVGLVIRWLLQRVRGAASTQM